MILDSRLREGKRAMEGWVLHDLRRSFVTHMAERLEVLPHIIEAIVNHVSGTKAGVAGVYNRAIYKPARREALERWSAFLEENGLS